MKQTESVNSSVKPSASTLRRYDFTSLGNVVEVPGGDWVKFDDVRKLLTNSAKRPEDSFSDETRGKMPVDGRKPILDDPAGSSEAFFEAMAQALGANKHSLLAYIRENYEKDLFNAVADAARAVPIHRKNRKALLDLIGRQANNNWVWHNLYDLAKAEYLQAQLELAKANKGIRRLRNKLDAAKKKIAEWESAFNDLAQPEGELKRLEEIVKENKELYKQLAEEYPPYAKGHGGRPGAISIGDGKVLTSDGDILPG